MKDLGSFLKRARINNGVSLEEASNDLELSIVELENIESGNTKAFKDIYELKENIRLYAKYLGLKLDEVMDAFNEYLFEKTSKISLEDINEALKKEQKNQEEKEKIKSPYTMTYKKKIYIMPIIIWIAIILLVVSICLLIIKNINKEPVRKTELKSILEEKYEHTY